MKLLGKVYVPHFYSLNYSLVLSLKFNICSNVFHKCFVFLFQKKNIICYWINLGLEVSLVNTHAFFFVLVVDE